MKSHTTLLFFYCILHTAYGSEPYYEPDFCSRIVYIKQNIIRHRAKDNNRFIRDFLVFEIKFPPEEAWLYEDALIAMLFPILPRNIRYENLQFFESTSYARKPDTIIVFRKTVAKKINYLVWVRIICYDCHREVKEKQFWRPELYIAETGDERLKRCRLWEYTLNCNASKYCKKRWYRLKIARGQDNNLFPALRAARIKELSVAQREEQKRQEYLAKNNPYLQIIIMTVVKALVPKLTIVLICLYIFWYKKRRRNMRRV